MDKYNFNPEEAFNRIQEHWRRWAASVGAKKWVIGISGGKDSTVVAALAARIFGNGSVLGVMMPNRVQSDLKDSREVGEVLGIYGITVNIGEAYLNLSSRIRGMLGVELSEDTQINLPARLRMCTLYAIAQTVGGVVLNTSNLSEDVVGYATLWGDDTGSYAPIQGLTVTEIRQLGDWLGLPHNLVHKTPVDGLQSKTDEEKLGFTYAELDRYIREGVGTDEFKARINALYRKNKFKTDMVHIVGPDFDYLGNFVRYNNLPDSQPKQEVNVIRIDAEPRYPEDAYINGVREDNDNPKMPFLVKDEESQDGWRWKIDIDIKTGEILGWPKEVSAKIHYKVVDCFKMKYGKKEYDGYVPDFMAIYDSGYGDYIKIFIEDGKIKDWNEIKCREFIRTEMGTKENER